MCVLLGVPSFRDFFYGSSMYFSCFVIVVHMVLIGFSKLFPMFCMFCVGFHKSLVCFFEGSHFVFMVFRFHLSVFLFCSLLKTCDPQVICRRSWQN